jgi:hypothetical protein
MAETYTPSVRNIAEEPWQEFPGHFGGALSKALVHPASRTRFRMRAWAISRLSW